MLGLAKLDIEQSLVWASKQNWTYRGWCKWSPKHLCSTCGCHRQTSVHPSSARRPARQVVNQAAHFLTSTRLVFIFLVGTIYSQFMVCLVCFTCEAAEGKVSLRAGILFLPACVFSSRPCSWLEVPALHLAAWQAGAPCQWSAWCCSLVIATEPGWHCFIQFVGNVGLQVKGLRGRAHVWRLRSTRDGDGKVSSGHPSARCEAVICAQTKELKLRHTEHKFASMTQASAVAMKFRLTVPEVVWFRVLWTRTVHAAGSGFENGISSLKIEYVFSKKALGFQKKQYVCQCAFRI